mmetsp:Transcript_2765/g.4335  ORF Transcript_2765/g.4335 Transcript_2765/m.4335 type:complete len:272 (-) Transcript_2765:230-1045(-)
MQVMLQSFFGAFGRRLSIQLLAFGMDTRLHFLGEKAAALRRLAVLVGRVLTFERHERAEQCSPQEPLHLVCLACRGTRWMDDGGSFGPMRLIVSGGGGGISHIGGDISHIGGDISHIGGGISYIGSVISHIGSAISHYEGGRGSDIRDRSGISGRNGNISSNRSSRRRCGKSGGGGCGSRRRGRRSKGSGSRSQKIRRIGFVRRGGGGLVPHTRFVIPCIPQGRLRFHAFSQYLPLLLVPPCICFRLLCLLLFFTTRLLCLFTLLAFDVHP